MREDKGLSQALKISRSIYILIKNGDKNPSMKVAKNFIVFGEDTKDILIIKLHNVI